MHLINFGNACLMVREAPHAQGSGKFFSALYQNCAE